jgi:carbamate kinase
MRIVVALDDREYSSRRTPWETLRSDVRALAKALAPIANGHQLLLVYAEDVAVDGSLGHLIEQELGNLLPFEVPLATLRMMVEIDRRDAMPVGPTPVDVFELQPIRWLLEHGTVVICAGGAAATLYERGAHRRVTAVQANVDIDLCAELLAEKLDADLLWLTDVGGVPSSLTTIRRASPAALATIAATADPTTAKLRLSCRFVRSTGKSAALGAIRDGRRVVSGEAGLTIAPRCDVVYVD